MISANQCFTVFNECIDQYHIKDSVDQPLVNPYNQGSVEALLFHKCWIDTVQWHYEDLIRDPGIDPVGGMELKRKIDKSNQKRTDMVEQIDDWFLEGFKEVKANPDAKLNTESPAWVVDRLSILALKIYHMQEQANRNDVSREHQQKSQARLHVLLEQKVDLSQSFDQLLKDIASGNRKMKVYRQMKLYNDPSTNPVLYGKKL
ncbi:MAG: DUF4254 domain-containing protein [Cyclobacteriaceae bacterium]|nr:DUF4254 domain-containing protein [Cyclobacteriaceae bacterium]